MVLIGADVRSHFNTKDARKVHGLNTQSSFIRQTHVDIVFLVW
jgi:hypothetical protein